MTAAAVRARYVTHATRSTKPSPVMLADYLAGFRARGQGAWPSQRHLAARFGVHVRTIQRWTTQLCDAGLLHVERSKPRHDHITGRWRRRTNRYRCTFNKKRRGQVTEKALLTPRRHLCRVDALFEEPCSGPAPESAVDPPPTEPETVAPPPWEGSGLTPVQWTKRQLREGRDDD